MAGALAAGGGIARAQSPNAMTKEYEDARFRISYMHWTRGEPAVPYRSEGPAVAVFLGDGALQASAFGAVERHVNGEVSYLESGAVINGGMLASGTSLRAVVVELKNVGSSRPLQDSGFAPAFPRADATPVLDNSRVIVWRTLYRPGQQLPILVHEKNSVLVWLNDVDIDRAYPNQPSHRQHRSAGVWEMIKAGVVMSELAVDRPAQAVTIELK